MAVSADGTLRKETDHFPFLQQSLHIDDRLFHSPRRDRYCPEKIQKPFEIPLLIDRTIHHKAHTPRHRHLDQCPVNPGDVVAQHQHTPSLGEMLKTQNFKPEAYLDNRKNNKLHQ